VRKLPVPAGYRDCSVNYWWPDGRGLGVCQSADSSTNSALSDLFLFPLSGDAPTQLTKATRASTPSGMGYSAAWPLSRGTLVLENAACGAGPLSLLTSPSTSQRLTFTFPPTVKYVDPHPDPVAVVGDTAYLLVHSSDCSGDVYSLVAYDVVSGRSGALLGPGVNDGTVGSALVIDPLR
jgi:hypothetical protein